MVDLSNLGTTEWEDLDVSRLVLFTSLATVLDNAIAYPFWSLKTRQQVDRGEVRALSGPGRGGIQGLYKGFGAYAVASLPAYVVYVTSYTWSKSALGFTYGQEMSTAATAVVPLAAGVIADAACLGLYVPVDVVTQRLQLPGRYTGARQAVTRIWRDEGGVRAFYRGFGATLITSGVSSGVWWLAYENLKPLFSAAWHSEDGEAKQGPEGAVGVTTPSSSSAAQAMEHSVPHMAAGFVSGGLAALASNPFDVVKTRLQTQQLARHDPRPAGLREFANGLRCLVVEEGLRGALFRGLVPKLVTTAPLGMLSSALYEGILYLSRKDTPLSWPKPPVDGADLEISLKEQAAR